MTKRLILFLIRRRLGLKKFQHFRFVNQKSDAEYYFGNESLIKVSNSDRFTLGYVYDKSNVSLNYLLSEECKITTTYYLQDLTLKGGN